MALPLSRPDPSSPDAVAAATFSTTRRGFDQGEVRDFLRMVAAELARLQERERYLDRELRTAQRGAPNPAVALDEEVVTRLLGEEAARILSTSREAASQIKIRAEESAARLLREATDEAQRIREEAQLEAARRRQDATADAESEIEMAKQQGREMVNEARAYRERVLGELARRRELAREQIEQLVHGRDRLVQAFERARLAAVDVMAELVPLGEPSEYVNLAPTTGPVPVMVPNQPPPVAPVASAAPMPALEAPGDSDATAALRRVQPELVEEVEAAPQPARVVSLFAGEVIIDVPTPVEERTVATEPAAEPDGDAEPDGPPADDARAADDASLAEATTTGLDATDEEDGGEQDEDAAIEVVDATLDGEAAEPQLVAAELVADEAEPSTGAFELPAAAEPEQEPSPEAQEPQASEPEASVPEPADVEPADSERADTGSAATNEPEVDEPAAAATLAPTTPGDPDAAAVDDLFARLRAARAASVAERAALGTPTPAAAAASSAADATTPLTRPEPRSVFDPSPSAPPAPGELDDSPFGRRDAALTALIITCARKLKRVLADEQNDVLHTLRRAPVVTAIEPMLPGEVEHGQRYASAIAAELTEAAAAGGSSVSAKSRSELTRRIGTTATAPAIEALTTTIVAPLRERLMRAVTDADGDNTELASLARAIYREWKIQQIDEHLDEVVRIAFGRGALAALDPGTPVRWVHDPRFPVCADCDDNGLSGVIGAGEPFATGQPCAPAHEGCRCMLAVAAG